MQNNLKRVPAIKLNCYAKAKQPDYRMLTIQMLQSVCMSVWIKYPNIKPKDNMCPKNLTKCVTIRSIYLYLLTEFVYPE